MCCRSKRSKPLMRIFPKRVEQLERLQRFKLYLPDLIVLAAAMIDSMIFL